MSYVRSAPRALIVEKGELLTIVLQHEQGDIFHVLPGGGQRYGETLHESLKRECYEELGVGIEIGEVAYVREYIGEHHEFSHFHQGFHQLEVVFRCQLLGKVEVAELPAADHGQIGVAWLPLEDLSRVVIYPSQLVDMIRNQAMVFPRVYLGDIN